MKKRAKFTAGQLRFKASKKLRATADALPNRFDIVAYTGGPLNVDGFDLPVVIDLKGLTAEGNVPIACKHDTSDEMILGETDAGPHGIRNNGRTLCLAGRVTADPNQSPVVKRVLTMAKRGHHWQASVGADLEETIDVPAGASVTVNGQRQTGPFILATRSVLRETSVLGMGADRFTRVLLAQAKGATMSFEEWLAKLGFDPASLSEEAKQVLMQQYTAQQQGDVVAEGEEDVEAEGDDDLEAEGDEDVEAEGETDEEKAVRAKAGRKGKGVVKAKGKPKVKAKPGSRPHVTANQSIRQTLIAQGKASIQAARRQFAEDMRRVETIRAKYGSDKKLAAAAVEKGWSIDKTARMFYERRDRANPPSGHRPEGGGSGMLQALQGAMILRAGGRIDHPNFGGRMGIALGLPKWLRAGVNTEIRQKAMEAAWEFRDMSMVDLCKAGCRIDGKEPTERSNKGYIQAAVSGGSVADIFTTSVNAILIEKLEEAGDTTVGWTRERDANNFQPMDRTRLVKGSRLTPHARGGKADGATRDDINEQYKISRYSQIFTVDEQDMIDDHFQALADIPDEMALACGRLRPDLVYSILLANAALTATGQNLFSATQPGSQSNLAASGGTLSSATLQAAMAAMFNFLENAVGLNIYPTHALVPMVLAGPMFNLLQGQNIALAGTAGSITEKGDVNPLAALQAKFGKIEVVTDQRLTNGVTDPVTGTVYSGSATTWRLASNRVQTIEVSYLKGSGRAPEVRQFVMDKGQWGIGWDVKLDIGAKALEWRGLYESRA